MGFAQLQTHAAQSKSWNAITQKSINPESKMYRGLCQVSEQLFTRTSTNFLPGSEYGPSTPAL